MTFNAKKYAWAIAHGVQDYDDDGLPESERPVTLGEHQAAEREARHLVEARMSYVDEDFLLQSSTHDGFILNVPLNVILNVPEASKFETYRDIADPVVPLERWARDLLEEIEGWEFIAGEFLSFKKKKVAA